MNKREDITKLSKDAKIDFPVGKTVTNFLQILLFLSISTSAQTNLNNFGVSDFIQTYKKFSKFSKIDLNKDGIEDLFLYGNKEKSFVLHFGIKDSSYSSPIKKFFFYPIDDFKWLTKSTSGVDYYIFTSRNKRLVGLVSFTKSNSLQLLHTIKYNSYPTSIEIIDLNNDGKNEALVYGNNFNGLEIIRNEGYRLESETVFENSLFNDISIMDFNQDDYNDIVITDVLNNSLKFLENNEGNRFVLNREIERESNIYCLKKADFNSDGFEDIGVGMENGIEILEGDSVYSFSTSYFFSNNFPVENYLFQDLNRDGKDDFAIMNRLENNLEIHFNSFTQPYAIFCDGISDIKFQKSGNKNVGSIITLSKNGIIQKLSSKNYLGKNFSYTPEGKIGNIKYLFTSSDSIWIIFNDLDENYLQVLTQKANGDFESVKKHQFINSFANFNFLDNLKTFYSYTENSRLLEIIYLKTNSDIERNFIYTENAIQQVKGDFENKIRISELSGDNLYYSLLQNSKGIYSDLESVFVDSSLVASHLNNTGDIFYWIKDSSSIRLHKFSNYERNLIFSANTDSTLSFSPYFVNDADRNIQSTLTVYEDTNGKHLLKIEDNKLNIYSIDSDIDLNWNNTITKVFYNYLKSSKIYSYEKTKKSLHILKLDSKLKKMSKIKSVEGIDANDYFVTDFFKNTYLVYSNRTNNSLSYKIIK